MTMGAPSVRLAKRLWHGHELLVPSRIVGECLPVRGSAAEVEDLRLSAEPIDQSQGGGGVLGWVTVVAQPDAPHPHHRLAAVAQ